MIKIKILVTLVACMVAYSGSSSAFGNLYDQTTIKPNQWGDGGYQIQDGMGRTKGYVKPNQWGDGGYQIQDNLGRTKQRCERNAWDGSVTCTKSPY